ncbi:23S rRNA (guanosine-2'-O-)-methyltransferase RlmB [Peptococcaceae bacterium CEB3]|nr:23S rRNA (guanosine-2'-O-)-methyltransferase RlmB [Peptococcaceae bacterium CEB3]
MITSMQNPLVKHVVALQQKKRRDEALEFVAEGWRSAGEALTRGARVKQVIYCPEEVDARGGSLLESFRRRGVPLEEVEARVLRKMSATEEPQGVLLLAEQAQFSRQDLRRSPEGLLLVVDGIQDPGNLGTMIRTALAAGVSRFCLTRGTVDIYNPKVVRGTMGALFSTVFLRGLEAGEVLALCREESLPVVVADVEGRSLYSGAKIPWPSALVVGNEGAGPARVFKERAYARVAIPMAGGVESLNVAMAAGIMLFEIVRQRDHVF